jgi:predicted transposase YbfD/YdcC
VLFPHCRQVVCINRHREKIKTGKTGTETVFGITSLSADKASPKQLLAIARGHWSIENKNHYVRDYTFDEDRSQVRTGSGPRVMATLRHFAISILRLKGYSNIAKAIRTMAAKPHLAIKMVTV